MEPAVIASGDPVKLMVGAFTVAVPLPEVKPTAEAVMLADPMPVPVNCGGVAGVVAPAAMVTVAGDTVTLVVSLLASVTVTPPAGAGADRVISRLAVRPRFTDALETVIDG